MQVPFLQASPSVAQHSFLAVAPLVQQEEDEAQEVSPVKATAAARASRDWMCFIVKVKRGRDGRFRKKKVGGRKKPCRPLWRNAPSGWRVRFNGSDYFPEE